MGRSTQRTGGMGIAGALLLLLAVPGAQAATRVYYSVGSSVADLKAGSPPNIWITAGAATFDVAQPSNVGIGDEITYGAGTKVHIVGRSSSTKYAVRTATGALPPDVVGSPVSRIARAFNSLSAAVAGSWDLSHLNTTDLVAADVQLNLACYADGPMNDIVNVTGWTTGPAQFIRIYAPTSLYEVGASQRHLGRQGTGFRLAPVATGNTNIVNLDVGYVRVEGVEIDGSGVTAAQYVRGINVRNGLGTVGDIRLDANLIHDLHTTVDGFANEGSMGILDLQTTAGSGPPMRVSNNVIYDVTNNGTVGHIGGIHIGSRATSYVHNNTVFGIVNNPGCAATCGPAWGIYAKTWQSGGGGSGTVYATNNYCGDVQAVNPVVLCYDARDGAVLVQSHNVSSDTSATGSGSQVGQTAYATYFQSIAAGAEDLHIVRSSLSLWGSTGADLSGDANLPVTVDVDGDFRARPDIGADESGSGCCELSVSDTGTRVTATGAGQFEVSWSAASGGGIDQLYDLANDPGRLRDLAGGEPAWNSYPTLFFDSIWYETFPAGAIPAAWYGWSAGDGITPDSKLSLLEATSTRVKVRQEAFYHHSLTQGTYRMPGMKGYGDYSLYGTGRLALRWRRATSATVTWGPNGTGGDIGTSDLDWAIHKDPAIPSLNTWAAYRPGVALPPNTTGGPGSGADPFLLMKGDYTAAAPNVRADFLVTRYSLWPDAQVSAHNDTSAGADKAAWVAWDDSRNTFNQRTWTAGTSETFDFLTSFRPTNLADGGDAAVTTRASDYTAPATITVATGSRWADADENTPVLSPTDFFNESEAAYLFDANPASGLRFDMTGAAGAPRYQPFLKVRTWRSVDPPTHVTVGGLALRRGVHYKADVKPFARAYRTADLSWHCTMQNAAACDSANIDVGSGGGINLGNGAIVAGRYGRALSVATVFNDSYVYAPLADFSMSVGAVEFWYQPYYDSVTASNRMLWYSIGGAGSDRDCVWLQHTGGNLVLRAYLSADNENCNTGGSPLFTLTATGASYFWQSGDWVHVRAEWNSGSFVRLLVDGRVVASAGAFAGGFTEGNVRFGSCQVTCPGGTGSSNADGAIDEPTLYYGMGSSGNPEPVAHAGLATDSRESLATPSSNASLLFYSVGAGRKGQYLYLGADSRFRGLNVDLAVAGAGVAPGALVWEYWRDNGAGTEGWASLEAVAGFTDGTEDFTKDGSVYWTAEPADWKPYSVSGGPDLYYVRVYLSGYPVSYSTIPVEDVIKTDILLFQYCSDVTSTETFVVGAPAPTAVELMSFSAVPGDGSVLLEWRTGSELDNLGFHMWRSLSAEGPWARLTTTLIPGLGSSPVGASYSWQDTGLANGTRYFYRLEDVDLRSGSTFHGPVSAVPSSSAPPPGGGGGGGSGGGTSGGATSATCPSWVVAALGSTVGGPVACSRHGEPESVSYSVLSRDEGGATLELRTGGFWAVREAGGTVRVFVPGMETPGEATAPALAVRRALVEAPVGKRVRLVSAQALDLRGFKGLRPSAVGLSEIGVLRDGTVRPSRRAVAAPRLNRGYLPQQPARLVGSVFQGEEKSAVVEMTPVRFDGYRQQLVLAGRVRVRLSFTGRETQEAGTGSRGRVAPRVKTALREALARLHTTRRGLHAVSFEELFPSRQRGMAVSQLRLQREGAAVAFRVEPASGQFGPGSTLYFWADRVASSTDFAGEVSWELVRSAEGPGMGEVSGAPEGSPVRSSPTGFASFETNRIHQPGLLEAPDVWLWEAMVAGVTKAVAVSLSGVDGASSRAARLVVFLQGGSDSGTPGEHHVEVVLNGTLLGEGRFSGKTGHALSLGVAAGLLREGSNTLEVRNVGDAGVNSLVFLDRVDVAYPQASAVRAGVFEGTWTETGTAEVGGMVTSPEVLDVTSTVSWVTGFEAGPGRVRFRAESGRRYVVVSREGLLSPRIAKPEPSALREASNQADYLVIAPREFLGAAGRLVERREGQGLSARAVSFEEIAEAFGHGRPSAEAIREFLTYAYHSWSRPSVRYVVLLGDATDDPRHFLSTSWNAPLPALRVKTSYLWTASDSLLGAVNGTDALPDLAIGRLPAQTPEEAERLVEKVLSWEERGQGLSGEAVLVADNPDAGGDFEADVAEVKAQELSGRATRVLKLSELGSGTRGAIQAAFDGGAGLLSYVGHGGAAVWASENVWNTWDVASLRAQSEQPFVLTLNCLNGYFVAPNFDSLSEALVKAEGRGAIGALSPSGLSLDGPAHAYHRAVVGELASERHERLGDAVVAAQKAYAETGLMPELLAVYQLLGDPAMLIR